MANSGPSPELIGCALRSRQSMDADMTAGLAVEALDMTVGVVATDLGLFESKENAETYRQRRQWFHDQRMGADAPSSPENSEGKARRRKPLNEFGHSENRDEYRERREWYHHATATERTQEVCSLALHECSVHVRAMPLTIVFSSGINKPLTQIHKFTSQEGFLYGGLA